MSLDQQGFGANDVNMPILTATLQVAWRDGIFERDDAREWVERQYDLTASSFSHHLQSINFAIRDEDVKLMEVVCLSAARLMGASTKSEVIQAALPLAILAWNLIKKGTRLSDFESKMLAMLKAHGPATDVEIAEIARRCGDDSIWSMDRVARTLRNLTNVQLNDGTPVAFVARDDAGRWRTVGV
jgi:hypothetical protein